jgi:hypothetical protein
MPFNAQAYGRRFTPTGLVNTAVTQTPMQRAANARLPGIPTQSSGGDQYSGGGPQTPGDILRPNLVSNMPYGPGGPHAPAAGSYMALLQSGNQAGAQQYIQNTQAQHAQAKAERMARNGGMPAPMKPPTMGGPLAAASSDMPASPIARSSAYGADTPLASDQSAHRRSAGRPGSSAHTADGPAPDRAGATDYCRQGGRCPGCC